MVIGTITPFDHFWFGAQVLWTNQPFPPPPPTLCPTSPLQQTMWAFNVACLELFLTEQIGWLVCEYNEAGQQDKTKQPLQRKCMCTYVCGCVCVCVCTCALLCLEGFVMNFQKSQQQLGEGAQHGMPTNKSYTPKE